MGDAEAYGKALEGYSSRISAAVGIFLGRVQNERAWWYAVIPGDQNEATMSPLVGMTEFQWLVCLRAMTCIHFTKKSGTEELVPTVRVEKIKAMATQSSHSALEMERSYKKFSKPKACFTVRNQLDLARDAEQHKTRASAPSSRRCPQIPEASTAAFRAAFGVFSKELAEVEASTSLPNVDESRTERPPQPPSAVQVGFRTR